MPTSYKGAEGRSEPLDSIEDVLCRSAAAWNSGDLEGLLVCCEDSPKTVYLNTTQIISGYTAIQKMYSERSETENAFGAGTLSMSLLRLAHLGSKYALAIGRYSLNRDSARGGPASRVCSLVFRKT
jgi:ketosteroid isomerase-like protein